MLTRRTMIKLIVITFAYATPTLSGICATLPDDSYYSERAQYIVEHSPKHGMPDGEYVFMATNVPDHDWQRYQQEASGRQGFRGFVIRGFTIEQIKSIRKQVTSARMKGEEPKIPAWVSAHPAVRPGWFRALDIQRVPAFVIKHQNDVCIAYGESNLDMAKNMLRLKGCPFLRRK